MYEVLKVSISQNLMFTSVKNTFETLFSSILVYVLHAVI